MTRKSGKTLDLLRGLLAERQQYEQWLAALAKKRPDTSEQVYERVHADYQSRLNTVVERLGSHTDDLQSNLADLTSQIADVTKREKDRRDELQEAELRAAVGEYTAEKWEEISSTAQSDLSRIADERKSLEDQHAEVTGILEVVRGRAPAAQPAPAAAGAPAHEATRAPGGQESGRADRVSEQLVMDTALADVPNDAPAAAAAGLPPDLRTAENSDLIRGDAASEPSEGGMPFPDWEAPLRNTSRAASATVARGGAPETTRPEQQKTLKCPACGAMNFPTEWYCEQCGGELAAL